MTLPWPAYRVTYPVSILSIKCVQENSLISVLGDMPCLQLLYAQDASGYSASRWRNILGRVLSSAPALKHVVIDTGTRVNCLYPVNALRENGLKRVADDFLFSLSMTPIITKSAQPLVDDIPRDSGTHALLPDRSYNPIFTPIKVIGTDWTGKLSTLCCNSRCYMFTL